MVGRRKKKGLLLFAVQKCRDWPLTAALTVSIRVRYEGYRCRGEAVHDCAFNRSVQHRL